MEQTSIFNLRASWRDYTKGCLTMMMAAATVMVEHGKSAHTASGDPLLAPGLHRARIEPYQRVGRRTL